MITFRTYQPHINAERNPKFQADKEPIDKIISRRNEVLCHFRKMT